MNRSTLALLAAALAFTPTLGLAAPKKPAATPMLEPAKTPVVEPAAPAVVELPVRVEPELLRGKIAAVDRAAQTLVVKLDKRGQRTIYIVQLPKGPDGQPGVTWDQLKVGAEVEVLARMEGRKLVAKTLALAR